MPYTPRRVRLRLRLAAPAIVLAATVLTEPHLHSQASSPCGAGINPIACENQKAGDPAAVWDVQGSGDPSIQGFATVMSVDQGEVVAFKVHTSAADYRLDIYRMGYYGGMGARKVATVLPSATLPQSQPQCLVDSATGLVDCGNWRVSASWAVPHDAVSGIYFARAVRSDTGGASHLFFVVRDDDGRSDLLFQTSDTTWQAYNDYGGNSLYTGAPAGRAFKVSYNRPFITRTAPSGGVQSWVFNAEYPMVRWLEANGYDVSYTTGIDTDRRGAELLEHRVFLSVGHDEYWSAAQRANVEAAREAGVHLGFFSGNEMFWKTRWENSIDGSGTPYRTLVCYKETHANAKIDPSATWTGTWRDPRFSPPADGGRPENALTGTMFAVNGTRTDAMTVPAADGRLRFWRNTTVASLGPGQTATLPAGTLGYEWDAAPADGFTPPGVMRLSSTTPDVGTDYLLDYGSNFGAGVATHSLTLYRHDSGALVFGAGTVQWSWGLDAAHDRAGTPTDQRMQQATVNLLADMGVQPQSLQSGLTAASASLDSAKPSSTITSPAAGSTIQGGQPVTIAGTAHDEGGTVAAVEVSVDGGATWRAATGRSTWTYNWTPAAPGSTPRTATVMSRAVDDSGNLETAGAGVTVTIAPIGGLVAAYGFEEGTGSQVLDISGSGNNGTILGATWIETGRFGRALTFDGAGDWVTVNDANSLDLTDGVTLEAWINPSASGGWRSAILKETADGLAYALYTSDYASQPGVTLNIGGSDRHTPGGAALPLDTWTHVAATYDGTTARLYLNGILVGNHAIGGPVAISAGALRIGGNAVWGEYVQGAIDEVRIYRRAVSAEEIRLDMETPVGGEAAPDATPPAVSMSAPASGSTLAGSTTVAASASDDVGVTGVQFLLDGSPLGAEDVSAPYSIGWNTTTAADGAHTLSARARDAAGNTTTAVGVPVTVANAPDAAPPAVSLTAPVDGATVSGIATVSATASDDVAVAGVTFLVDGIPVGAEDPTAPYEAAWDTRSTPNGSHTVSARARDAAGKTTTSTGATVTVSNAAPSDLVAAYAFDEGAGTLARDASAHGNAGTLSNATWVADGRFGNALSFDGTSSMVTIADAASLDLTTGMTLEAWLKPTALGGWRSAILKETSNGLAYAMYAHNNAPYPAATINVGGADVSALGMTALALDTWTHVAVTYDGATLRLFINGGAVGALTVSGPMATSAGPLTIGGNTVWGEHFSGLIDEVRVYSRALSPGEIQNDMTRAIGSGSPTDSTPPFVTVTSPSADAAVAGTITVAADATDASGIAGVEFRVDGTPLGPEDRTAPFEYWWNTGGLTNGAHTLTAVAYDAAGNSSTSAPVTVTVANPTDAASIGAWSAPFDLGMVAVNMVLLNTGKVLMYPGWFNAKDAVGGASVFDPATGAITPTPISTSNIFCSGHATLADGRVLVAGGWDDVNGILGLDHANVFDPATEQWTRVPNMAHRRWYPSALTLSDGRVLVLSGATTCETCIADVPEVYDPATNSWMELTGARLSVPYYPFTFVLPDGRVLDTGSSDTATAARILDVASQSWTMVDPRVVDGSSAAMFLPGKVLQSGTASDPAFPAKPAQTSTAVLDMTQPSPAWRDTAPMAFPRAYNNLTILPDGTVLAVGGGTETSGVDVANAVYAAERWSPATETWTTMANAQVPRLYHSTSLLLPDGRVLVAGGGQVGSAPSYTAAEYYSPPYLFKGARPALTSAPAVVEYGSSFSVGSPDAAAIESVALIRTGAATHAFDENQRFVPVTFAVAAGGLTLHAPATPNLAPPGDYLLFILNGDGVPSVARFVRLAPVAADAEPPTAPGSLIATGSIGSITLDWTASTDNLGVTGYDVHRSTSSGFIPSVQNRIAQTSATSYADGGLTAGTYYYIVIARDAAGNVSTPSNEASGVASSDTTPPGVAITNPANGATVSGTVQMTADASDNVAVTGVQFLLDGAALGPEDATAPYAISWDTRTASNGAHVLSARARDAAGNSAAASNVSVSVSNIAPAGLVAAYAFNEGAGTTATDATGKAHTGTITGATWTTLGKNGGALSFDGVDDWVTVADAADLDLTNAMTIEAWVRPRSLRGWNTVMLKENSGGLAYSLYANDNAPKPAVTVGIGSLDRSAMGTGALPLDTWSHLAATYDGATLRLYVNGVLAGSRSQTGNINTSTGPLRFGGNAVWGEYFNGLIDDVRIYGRVLSAAEIQSDMTTRVQ